METTVTSQFVLLSLHPEKGRVLIRKTHFRYALAGSVLMDFLLRGEISLENKRLVPGIRKNGEKVHDMFAEIMDGHPRPRRISFWIRRLSLKSYMVFKETVSSLTSSGILMNDRRYFINIVPYNRYILTDKMVRKEIIEGLRGVLLHGKEPTGVQSMLIGLLKAARAHYLLAKERSERSVLRIKCRDFKTEDEMASEIDRAIREVQAAIIASVTAASITAGSSH
jgi:hypothetical protein